MTLGTRDYLANRTPVPTSTLPRLFFEAVEKFKDKAAFKTIGENGFNEISYEDVLGKAQTVAGGLRSLGVNRGDRVAILSENRPEWSQADFGAVCTGIPLVPIHTTLTTAQIRYILRDSGAKRFAPAMGGRRAEVRR